jgi:hypothetical protein
MGRIVSVHLSPDGKSLFTLTVESDGTQASSVERVSDDLVGTEMHAIWADKSLTEAEKSTLAVKLLVEKFGGQNR